MNLFGLRAIRRLPAAASALTLLAAAIGAQAAPVEDYGINYTWVEGGWSRMNDRSDNDSSNFDGGYLRGSFALGDTFYLLGGYNRNQDTLTGTIQPEGALGTFDGKGKVTFSQIELGIGFHVPMAERVDFVGELTALRLDNKVKITIPAQTNAQGESTLGASGSLKDHVYAGKGLVGIRAKPFDMVDVWAKAGYYKTQKLDDDSRMFLRIDKSALANFGVQLQLTPNFGLVGEADIYKKDLRYYRAGVRVSF